MRLSPAPSGSYRLRKEPAIYPQVTAGDETAGLRTCQEHGGADELLWTTESPQRGVIPDRSGSFCGGTVIIEQQFSVLFRGKESWSNRVTLDPNGPRSLEARKLFGFP